MIREWLDISAPLDVGLPTWPGSPGLATTLRLSVASGDIANVTQLEMDVHTGTHIDAPRHFIPDGATVDELGLEPFLGRAVVVDTGEATDIDSTILRAAGLPAATERVLLRTCNSSNASMYSSAFDERYAGLTLDGASWLAEQGVQLVGIDYLSIQKYTETPDVHRVLLGAGMAILEGLCLHDVAPGEYDLICLPINLFGAEAAPARAILTPCLESAQ